MKTYAHTLLVAIAMITGGCAVGAGAQSHAQAPTTFSASAASSSGSARRDIVATSIDRDREPAGMYRAERGIPTPQPARDPSFVAIPVPQPPLPGPDPHHGGRVSARDSAW